MTRIAIALQNDFADWEPALLMAAARYYLNCDVVTASPDGAPVVSMGGLKVMPDIGYDAIDAETFDALVIPGGYAWEKGVAYDFTDLAVAFRDKGKVLGGICAAASGLAATGVLNMSPIRATPSPHTSSMPPIRVPNITATRHRRSATAALLRRPALRRTLSPSKC